MRADAFKMITFMNDATVADATATVSSIGAGKNGATFSRGCPIDT